MSTPINQMSLAEAQETFFYDDSDGRLYWKIRPRSRTMWGDKAGNLIKRNGYYKVVLRNKDYRLHNIIWNWHYGAIPMGKTVDHIDKDKSNNHISNLRLATKRQQRINISTRGFNWDKRTQRWHAQHGFNNKKLFLGRYATALQARLAYEKATSDLEPEFASTFFTDAINRLCAE
jgi:hypothetical protein